MTTMLAAALRGAVLFTILAAACTAPAPAKSVRIAWQAERLPVSIGGHAYHLDTLLAYPDDGRAHPLVLLSHGSPRNALDRPLLRPSANEAQVLWYVSHGFTVASVMRRGYGRSDGAWAETYGPCAHPDYASAGERGAADIAASIAALRANPHVDASRVLALGVSAGAFATVALTAHPPPGLAAAIAFAPGRGSTASDTECDADALIAAFARYGATSRVPLLWISAANDHFFGPALVARLRGAFASGGAHLTFLAAPADGAEGHYLFSDAAAVGRWGPAVAAFLAEHGLALPGTPYALTGPDVPAPPSLGSRGRAAFAAYLLAPPHKAFAASPSGAYGYATGKDSGDDAAARARAACPPGPRGACALVNVDDAGVR